MVDISWSKLALALCIIVFETRVVVFRDFPMNSQRRHEGGRTRVEKLEHKRKR